MKYATGNFFLIILDNNILIYYNVTNLLKTNSLTNKTILVQYLRLGQPQLRQKLKNIKRPQHQYQYSEPKEWHMGWAQQAQLTWPKICRLRLQNPAQTMSFQRYNKLWQTPIFAFLLFCNIKPPNFAWRCPLSSRIRIEGRNPRPSFYSFQLLTNSTILVLRFRVFIHGFELGFSL